MTGRLLQTVIRRAESLAAELGPEAVSDADLLARFAANRDESSFAVLINRHGPMVWAVCRHLLLDPADAEDAFQATFLALVRSARALPAGSAVGGWLHGVAVRSAAKLRRSAARRRKREERAARPEAGQPVPDAAWEALIVALHEEVQLLPEVERTAFVLCDLEGVRQPDAAARLGWKLGTLSGRLTKARQTLLARLASRGIAPAVASGGLVVGAAAAGGAVPAALAMRTVGLSGAAADVVPPDVWKLALEVTPMTVNRTKVIAACLLLAGGLAAGLGPVLFATADAQAPPTGGGPGGDASSPPAGRTADPSAGASGGGDGVLATPGADGGMGSAMGGMSAPAEPARTRWEYQYENKPRTVSEFSTLLRRYGERGWEFAGIVEFAGEGGIGGLGGGIEMSASSSVVFKRPVRWAPGGPRLPGGPGPGGYDPRSAGPASMGGPTGLGSMGPASGRIPSIPTGNQLAGPPAGASGFQVITLKHARARDLADTLKQLLGNVQAVGDTQSNSIILKGDAAEMQEIVELIRKLDVPGAADAAGGGTGGGSGGLPPNPGPGRPPGGSFE